MEQISVIVPIFNNEEFVEKCVRSILAQTHPNLQIVLVNDGSTDSSLQICQRLRDADERVLVYIRGKGDYLLQPVNGSAGWMPMIG